MELLCRISQITGNDFADGQMPRRLFHVFPAVDKCRKLRLVFLNRAGNFLRRGDGVPAVCLRFCNRISRSGRQAKDGNALIMVERKLAAASDIAGFIRAVEIILTGKRIACRVL